MRTTLQSYNESESYVEITGICNPSDMNDTIIQYPYWKQMHISETLQIPTQKPNVERVNSMDISVAIFKKHVIQTPRTYDDSVTPPVPLPNIEGKVLTGRKLIIEGQLCQKVVYTADVPEQSVHSAHFYVPFSSYIVVPRTIVFTSADGTELSLDACQASFEVNACVEAASICVLDERSILKQVTLMLSAVPTQQCGM